MREGSENRMARGKKTVNKKRLRKENLEVRSGQKTMTKERVSRQRSDDTLRIYDVGKKGLRASENHIALEDDVRLYRIAILDNFILYLKYNFPYLFVSV